LDGILRALYIYKNSETELLIYEEACSIFGFVYIGQKRPDKNDTSTSSVQAILLIALSLKFEFY